MLTRMNNGGRFAPHSGRIEADRLASAHGFVNVGQIGDLEGYFLFEHARARRRARSPESSLRQLLEREPEVAWFEQQQELRRPKRDSGAEEEKAVSLEDVADGHERYKAVLVKLVLREADPFTDTILDDTYE